MVNRNMRRAKGGIGSLYVDGKIGEKWMRSGQQLSGT